MTQPDSLTHVTWWHIYISYYSCGRVSLQRVQSSYNCTIRQKYWFTLVKSLAYRHHRLQIYLTKIHLCWSSCDYMNNSGAYWWWMPSELSENQINSISMPRTCPWFTYRGNSIYWSGNYWHGPANWLIKAICFCGRKSAFGVTKTWVANCIDYWWRATFAVP